MPITELLGLVGKEGMKYSGLGSILTVISTMRSMGRTLERKQSAGTRAVMSWAYRKSSGRVASQALQIRRNTPILETRLLTWMTWSTLTLCTVRRKGSHVRFIVSSESPCARRMQ